MDSSIINTTGMMRAYGYLPLSLCYLNAALLMPGYRNAALAAAERSFYLAGGACTCLVRVARWHRRALRPRPCLHDRANALGGLARSVGLAASANR
jgi:hypothetical protein